MRYLVKLKVTSRPENYPKIRSVLKQHGFDLPYRDVVEIALEQSDPRVGEIVQELRSIGHEPFTDYDAAFEPGEVEQAELLLLRVSGLCGRSFADWTEALDLPVGTLVMDKREMGKQDIARTYRFEVVISERLKRILTQEKLSGWEAQPIQHRDPHQDRYPDPYHFTATTELPPLAPETKLHEEKHTKLLEWPPGHPWRGKPDPLLGTTGRFQRGPLYYWRASLDRMTDFQRTHEVFGEATESHPLVIVSQRAWQVFGKHSVRKVDVEPVVILD